MLKEKFESFPGQNQACLYKDNKPYWFESKCFGENQTFQVQDNIKDFRGLKNIETYFLLLKGLQD